MVENKNFSCHIIGLNPYTKKNFIDSLNKKIFNIIDLDIINQEILNDDQLDILYRQYLKLKEIKNDKYKEIDKKMSIYWENKFAEKIVEKISNKKMNILLGQNNHYKSLTKRVNLECTTKFLINSPIENEVKTWIKYNLETYNNEIINGEFPLDYINYEYLIKKRTLLENIYKKIGYMEKTYEELLSIIHLLEKHENKTIDLWISMKEPYNVGSLIYPINEKITSYKDSKTAILKSINNNNLKTQRFLYLVESKTFIPNNDKESYISQLPVKILLKEKINNINEYINKISN